MNVNPLEMIAGIIVGFTIAFVFLNLFFGRTMTVVLGQRFKTQAGSIHCSCGHVLTR